MKNEKNLYLPAECAILSEEEAENTIGGGDALETAGKAVVAVGVAGALLMVAGVAARGILSVFHPNGVEGAIEDSIHGGKNFIDGAVSAGQSFLDKLMGR